MQVAFRRLVRDVLASPAVGVLPVTAYWSITDTWPLNGLPMPWLSCPPGLGPCDREVNGCEVREHVHPEKIAEGRCRERRRKAGSPRAAPSGSEVEADWRRTRERVGRGENPIGAGRGTRRRAWPDATQLPV